MIDKATIARIKEVADIVEVVSDYVHLTRRGTNYMGLCPFHNERTPSFSVNRRRNFCYCFSCHKGGSPVNFIMEKEGVSYHDALLHLAKKYGIKVEERELTDEEQKERTEREAMMVANEWAMNRMERDLHDTAEGRDIGLQYLYQRGITEEAIKAFHLGYAIDKGAHLTTLMRQAGFEVTVLRAVGLTGLNAQGHEYDKYRGRVIFPIFNPSGKTIAFGGRDLKGGPAKYINSPESRLYTKSNELYGIFQAKGEMVRQDKCYLVEGYIDVIGMWQSGLKNVVASSGTALTDGQINLIHRFTNNITLIYDGDAAGIKAAIRGMDMLLDHGMNVKVLLLPDGHDPDSFARAHTPEDFRTYIESNETDVIQFKIQTLMADSANNPQRRAEAISSICQTIAHIPNDVERNVYAAECSRRMGISEQIVINAVLKARIGVVDEFKRRREEQRLNKSIVGDNAGASPQVPMTEVSQSAQGRPEDNHQQAYVNNKDYPLRKLELSILQHAVRCGFLSIDDDDENKDDNEQNIQNRGGKGTKESDEAAALVIDLIDNEFAVDNIEFSVPEHQKIFEYILNLRDDFDSDRRRHEEKIRAEINARREDAIIKLGRQSMSIERLERKEREMEEALNADFKREMYEYVRHYLEDILISHEDTDIRSISTQLVHEPYTLSKRFGANDPYGSVESLRALVIRSLLELKEEILNRQLQEAVVELSQLGDSEEDLATLKEKQQYLKRLLKVRSEMARVVGDRILSPRSAIRRK